jgi:hypothetical protein
MCFNQRILAFVAIAIAIHSAGCSKGGLERVVVEGNVTYDGTPVANGEIHFYPTETAPGPLAGAPIKDGKYSVNNRGGVPVGAKRVEIRAYRPAKSSLPVGEGPPPEQYIPDKYNQRSEQTANITGDKDPMTLDFNLTK